MSQEKKKILSILRRGGDAESKIKNSWHGVSTRCVILLTDYLRLLSHDKLILHILYINITGEGGRAAQRRNKEIQRIIKMIIYTII